MEGKKTVGSIIYTLIGILIFGFLAYVMFNNYYRYIGTDWRGLCIEQGGTWDMLEEECLLEEKSPVKE
tara:strand:+ start:267 stop:470 length:204 start_codon:yes stop_codon:yes gene_type:complete